MNLKWTMIRSLLYFEFLVAANLDESSNLVVEVSHSL